MDIRKLAAIAALCGLPGVAQDVWTLNDAVNQALRQHPLAKGVEAGVGAATAHIREARAGYLPKLNLQEGYNRSNNPVFVFSSLLSEHQFGPQNFEIGNLNRPVPLGNFQSVASIEQTLFDGGRTKSAVMSAGLERTMRQEDERAAQMNIVARVARAYYQAVVSGGNLRVADEAVHSAEADLQRAEASFRSGMSTNADVLAIRVHLASMKEQQIRRKYELESNMAALNDAAGLPLETPHLLAESLQAAALTDEEEAGREERTLRERPEARQAKSSIALAQSERQATRSALMPQVEARFVLETDTQHFVQKGGANWLAGVTLRWNLFNGGADSAAQQAAAFRETASRENEIQLDSAMRLEVRRTDNEWRSANERLGVAQEAVSMAEENLRIVRNRYESGLSTVTELLRSELALSEARNHNLAAIGDQRNAALNMELAAGTLSAGSASLR